MWKCRGMCTSEHFRESVSMAELACMVFEAASGLQKVLRLSSSDPNLGVTKSLFSSWAVAAFVTSRTGGQMSRWRLVFRFSGMDFCVTSGWSLRFKVVKHNSTFSLFWITYIILSILAFVVNIIGWLLVPFSSQPRSTYMPQTLMINPSHMTSVPENAARRKVPT